jgi:outer membrane protein assembly factor BamB/tetratricopeptide (TPR) repeat protein
MIREREVAFKGDLKDINLADIFQTLAMNQQEGTLVISSGEKRTDIYFSKQGIRLLTTGGRKYPLIGELLLKKKKLSSVELDMALAKQRMTGELIGNVLVGMGAVTEQDIQDCVRKQIEEEIHEVFSWSGAKFEFIPGEPEAEFFDPARLGRPITFSVNEIIMEAARRVDEWEMIHQRIPYTNAIYAHREHEVAIPDVSYLGFSTNEIFQIAEFIDGRRTIEDIIEKASLGRFEVCKILAAFVDAGYIAKLDLQQTVEIADRLHKSGDRTSAIKIYRDALIDHPDDRWLRTKLAELYEKDDMKNEAAVEYAKVADSLAAQGKHDDAVSLFKKALELSPRNFSIKQKLYQYYLAQHKVDLAAEEGLFVARTYWRMNRLQEAVDVLKQILDLSPDSIEVREMLINVLIDQQQQASALEHYEIIATVFAKQGNREGLAETYRKILAIDKSRSDIRTRLNAILSKGRRRALGRGRKAVLTLALLLALIGGFVAFLGHREISARREIKALSSRLSVLEKDKQIHGLQADVEDRYKNLATDIESFKKKYRFTMLVASGGDADSLVWTVKRSLAQFEKARNQKGEKRVADNAEILVRAKQLDKEGEFDDAYLLYEKVDKELLVQEEKTEVETKIRYLLDYLNRAKRCVEVAQTAEKNQNYEEAYQKYRELLRDFPCAALTEQIKLPLLVDSEPRGADVIIDDKSYGTTPQVIRRSPDQVVQVIVRKEGYKKPLLRVVEPDSWQAVFKLQRTVLWAFQTDGYAGSAIALMGDKVLAGTRNGVLYCIDIEKGTEVWRFSAGGVFGCFQAAPRVMGNRIYAGSFDQNIYALDADSGESVWQFKLGSAIGSSPSAPDSDGRFYIGCSDHFVYCINPQERKEVWRYQTGNEVLSTPLVCGDTVYFGGSDNLFRAIDARTGQEIWSFQTDGPITSTPAISGDTVLFTCQDSSIYALSNKRTPGEKEKRLIWKYKTDSAILSSPVVSEGFVYFSSSDGKVHCLEVQATSGSEEAEPAAPREVWKFETKGPVTSSPAVYGGVVYVGSADCHLYALSASKGELLWKYLVNIVSQPGKQAETIGTPVVTDKYIVFSAPDSKIYCLFR